MSHICGKTILLTRHAEQNIKIASMVAEYQAIPVCLPCLKREFLSANIQQQLQKMAVYDPHTTDIIFTSQNGVAAVAATSQRIADEFARYRVIAVGKKTAHALVQLGCHVDYIPDQASQRGLIDVYATIAQPKRVVFFRAEEGSDALSQSLRLADINVETIHAYRMICEINNPSSPLTELSNRRIDAVLLGSAKTAQCYVQIVDNIAIANAPIIVVISQQVAQEADKLGLQVQVVAAVPSFESMLAELNEYYASL